jgi:TonB family protein
MRMRRAFLRAIRSIVLLCCVVCAFVHRARAQAVATADESQTGVVLAKLAPPVYPPLARGARITGDVKVLLAIRQDGSVESAELFSSHPVLAPAAIESAKKSQFECRECKEAVTAYQLTYTFERKDNGDCCTAYSQTPNVVQSQGHVTITSGTMCICDPSGEVTRVKARSARCLYLWRCGLH